LQLINRPLAILHKPQHLNSSAIKRKVLEVPQLQPGNKQQNTSAGIQLADESVTELAKMRKREIAHNFGIE
jgi:hypothetical protein